LVINKQKYIIFSIKQYFEKKLKVKYYKYNFSKCLKGKFEVRRFGVGF